MAVEAALKLHDEGFGDVVDADIQGFFDNLSHPIIMQSVAERVADGNILRLVEKFLTSGVMDNGVFKPTSVGTPQGGVVSPLLANIVLNYLDWQLDHAGYRFVRYADDFVVLCQTPEQAKEALAFVQQVLEQRLKLHLSPEKTKVTSYGKGYSFLGFVLSSRSRRMRPKSVKKFKDKVRKLTCRKLNLDQAQVDQLNRVIRGTARYFATWFFTGRTTFNRLDCWIRMRLRCMKTKSKSRCHHLKLQNKVFDRLGLTRLESFCAQRP
jgi:RNA-directed DNA polymerase